MNTKSTNTNNDYSNTKQLNTGLFGPAFIGAMIGVNQVTSGYFKRPAINYGRSNNHE